MVKIQHPVRSAKSSTFGLSQYLEGRPLGNTQCCRLFDEIFCTKSYTLTLICFAIAGKANENPPAHPLHEISSPSVDSILRFFCNFSITAEANKTNLPWIERELFLLYYIKVWWLEKIYSAHSDQNSASQLLWSILMDNFWTKHNTISAITDSDSSSKDT